MSPENENENENTNTNKPDVTCSVCGALLSLEEEKNSEADMENGVIEAPMCDSCFVYIQQPCDEEYEDDEED